MGGIRLVPERLCGLLKPRDLHAVQARVFRVGQVSRLLKKAVLIKPVILTQAAGLEHNEKGLNMGE
jgi:hypothetical protein